MVTFTNLFLSFFEISVSVSVAAFVLLLFSPLLGRRYAAKWQYWIWIFLAIRLLIPITDARTFLQELPGFRQQEQSGSAHLPADAAAPGRVIVTLPRQMTTPLAVSEDETSAAFTLLDVLAVVWLAGAVIFLSVHLLSYWRYKTKVMRKGKPADPVTLRLLKQVKRELGIRQCVPVVVYDEAQSPMVTGFFRSVLVLPADPCAGRELYFILKHELVHWKRRDVYAKLLFVAANAVHWFNPAISFMRRAAGVDMELSCDERVMKGCGGEEQRAYTEALLAALSRQCRRKNALTTQFSGGKEVMKKRFQNILNANKKKNGWYIIAAAAILTVSLGALVGCSAMSDYPAVSGGKTEPDSGLAPEKDAVSGSEFAQMAGAWMIDFDRTDPTLWGTGISYGDALEISETGALTYYIGIGVGGTGQCVVEDKKVTVEITSYENLSSEMEMLTLRYESGTDEIVMDWHGETVYWVRGSIQAGEDSTASPDVEALRTVVDGFVSAYFGGDVQAVASYLAGTCEQGPEAYEEDAAAIDITVKGMPEEDSQLSDGRWIASVEFRAGADADAFWYLTIELIRTPDGWKVQFFGLEG